MSLWTGLWKAFKEFLESPWNNSEDNREHLRGATGAAPVGACERGPGRTAVGALGGPYGRRGGL
eukprot:8720-Pyramimonas_sp.AAC.1